MQEIKGKKRYGRGHLLRLGTVGIAVGRWTQRTPEEQAQIENGLAMLEPDEDGEYVTTGDDAVVRLIEADEIDDLRGRFNSENDRMLRSGWEPPAWHWRRWRDLVLPWLQHRGVLHVNAYDNITWRRPWDWEFALLQRAPWLRDHLDRLWARLPRRPDGWKPLQVVHDDQDRVA